VHFSDIRRDIDIVKFFMMEIDDPSALYAFKVLVIVHVAIVTLCLSGTLYRKCQPQFTELLQSSVNGVQRYCTDGFLYLSIDLIGRGMLHGLDKSLVNGFALVGYLKSRLAAPFLKHYHFFVIYLDHNYFSDQPLQL